MQWVAKVVDYLLCTQTPHCTNSQRPNEGIQITGIFNEGVDCEDHHWSSSLVPFWNEDEGCRGGVDWRSGKGQNSRLRNWAQDVFGELLELGVEECPQ